MLKSSGYHSASAKPAGMPDKAWLRNFKAFNASLSFNTPAAARRYPLNTQFAGVIE
jgi:hypothetical protein